MTGGDAASAPRAPLGDRPVGVLLLLVGVASGLEASTFDVAFLTDPVGPKALPYLVAAVFVFAGAHSLLRPRATLPWPRREAVTRITAAAAAFTLYAIALPWIGFFGATTLVVAALARLFGAPLARAAPAAAVLSGALWLMFVRLLSLPLPIGDLWMR